MAKTIPWIKDPSALLDFVFDWSEWAISPDDIKLSDINITPSGLVVNQKIVEDNKVRVWLSGGNISTYYKIVCRIETKFGRIDERTEMLLIKQR